MTEDTGINRNKIRQFKCNNCGGELKLFNKRSQYVACPYCGSVADSSSDAFKILTKQEVPSAFPPMSFIKLGLEATFDNKKYRVIGRTRRRNNYKEYWAEDGEQGYSNETWVLDEWLLISEDATYFIIVEDSEGYYIVNSILPKYPSLPVGEQMQDFFNNKSRRVLEYGDTEIMFFEGESTYIVQIGNKSSFSEYEKDDISYSAEWRYKDGVVKEIEFFREEPVSADWLKAAFGIDTQTNSEKQPIKQKKGKRLKNRYIIILAGIINLIIGFSIYDKAENKFVLNEKILAQELADVQGWGKFDDTLKYVAYEKTVSLDDSTKIIKIHCNTTIPDSSECMTIITMYGDNQDTLFENTYYSYNYDLNDDYFAFDTLGVQHNFVRDKDLREIVVKAGIVVPVDWQKTNSSAQSDIALNIEVVESDKLYGTIGISNLVLGFVLLGIGIVLLIARRGK